MSILKKHLQGIHVDHRKNTMNHAIETMPTPDIVYISMSQHIGAPCEPLVSVGDHVKIGQPIGNSEAFISAPVHSSVSGKVTNIEEVMSSLGTMDKTIIIKTDKKQELWEDIKIPTAETKEEFIKAIRDSGLVGLGGAAFPTHVKYNPRNLDEVDTLIVNGAECEPYITSDYRTMLEHTQDIVNGILLIMKHLELKQCYIGIEENKPEAIERLNSFLSTFPNIKVITLDSRYPQGAERVLIYETTGKVLPPGKLPADIGVIVSNITSIAFLAKYFRTGVPLISKVVTVDGDAVSTPKNVRVPIGTKIYEVINFCGGYKKPPKKIIFGGPMMGRAIYDDGKPIIKNNNAILAFDEDQALIPNETACINCGRCVQACPLNLMPTAIDKAYKRNDIDALKNLNVAICMECGCCSYVCPAKKQLSLVNKLSKALVKEAGK
ncbi:electron transport complex subunit RsxC [Anaerovorax odorimutans]|uniref:electron transport complex subunit RsxC n=1 Tax=Anaerovorax odorimutans TaxID=109327 RepID=UPI000414B55D|nr:electron transport complex subunit RsxC [Anaerovorax odorimutans]